MLVNDLKLLLRFNSDSLFEEVSQTNMTKIGTSSISVLPDGGGYVMQNDQYLFGDGILSNGYFLEIDNAITIGFLLLPVDPGIAVNPTTNLTSSIEMPLLTFYGKDSDNAPFITITEHSSESGKNSLKFSFYDGSYSAFSEEYSTLDWHFFWITFNGSSLIIYIDGKKQILQIAQIDPSINQDSFEASVLDLYINHRVDGYAWNVAKNYGIINDIFVFNTTKDNILDVQRTINDGTEFIVDDFFTSTFIEKYSIYYNDPETISITSLIDDMSYIFVGRNDGKILRGSPLLWEVRISFSDLEEIEALGLTETFYQNGFLKLINKTIRL